MNTDQTLATILNCTISDLKLYDAEGLSTATLEAKEPFRLSVTIAFSDTANNEISRLLMPLGLTVRTTFYAKPVSEAHEIELGNVVLKTEPDAFSYTAVLVVADPKTMALVEPCTYEIGALVRVGTTAFCMPSVMRGYLEGLHLQIGEPLVSTELTKELETTSNGTTMAKTARRKTTLVERGDKK